MKELAKGNLLLARRAQEKWFILPIKQRISCFKILRQLIARHAAELASLINNDFRRSEYESLYSEVLPLIDACQFAAMYTRKILASESWGIAGRPLWLWGNRVKITRDPYGLILLIGPENYPLFLLGVQLIQALIAGNAVIVKPGRHGLPVMQKLLTLCQEANIPSELIILLDENPRVVDQAIAYGVDKVILTGSINTAHSVLDHLSRQCIPATLELSGCDAVIVLPDANIDLLIKSLVFGLTLNKSATCMAPRRVYLSKPIAQLVAEKLLIEFSKMPTVNISVEKISQLNALLMKAKEAGFKQLCGELLPNNKLLPILLATEHSNSQSVTQDLFLPILCLLTVGSAEEAVNDIKNSSFRLTTSIFSESKQADLLAAELPTTVVLINDIIVGTADPRVPFGGRGMSGYGVTRGAAGLIEMTQIKVIISKKGLWRPHLLPETGREKELFLALIHFLHIKGIVNKLKSFWRLSQIGRNRLDEQTKK